MNPKSKNDIIRAIKAQYDGQGTLEDVYLAAGIDLTADKAAAV